jgi:ketosteroid isomerase-like protein
MSEAPDDKHQAFTEEGPILRDDVFATGITWNSSTNDRTNWRGDPFADEDVRAAQAYIRRVGGLLNPGDPEEALSPEQYARYHADNLRRQRVEQEQSVDAFDGYEALLAEDPQFAQEEHEMLVRAAIKKKIARRERFLREHPRIAQVRTQAIHVWVTRHQRIASARVKAEPVVEEIIDTTKAVVITVRDRLRR